MTGGTGALGRRLVDRLLVDGREVRLLSRRREPTRRDVQWAVGDLTTGDGVDAAAAGCPVIVHCATAGRAGRDVRAADVLFPAASRAACRHLVYVSIVGVDRVPLPYYRGKRAVELRLEGSGIPHTIQRATQFHDLLRVILAGASRLPVMAVPDLHFQPVDTRDVAARVAGLAVAGPIGAAVDLGGPEVRSAADLATAMQSATGSRRRIRPFSLPGKTFQAYRAGYHLVPQPAGGRITFEEYLAERRDVRRLAYRG